MRKSNPTLVATLLVVGIALGPPVPAEKSGFVRTESFRLLNEGVTAYANGRYAEAVEKLERSSAMALNSFRAYFYLGLARIGNRQYAEAVESLEIALDLDPFHLQALVALGNAQLRLGDIEEARAAYYRALKVRPEYPSALDGLARAYESQAKYRDAIAFYRRAIASNAGYAEAYTNLGELYLRQSRFDEAVKLLEEAVSIRPDYALGHSRLALAYSQLGLFNEAVASIQKAIDLEPANPEHPAALGMIQVDLELLARAEATFRAALELDPGQPLANRGMAEIHRRRGEYDLAIAQIDIALADDRLETRRRVSLETYRGEIATERDRVLLLEAKIDLREATPEEIRELEMYYAGRGLWSSAADLELRVPEDGIDHERLGYLLLRAERFREALEVYGVLGAESDRPEFAVNRGIALANLGKDAEAVEAYRAALAADDDLQLARLYLGNALLRLGRNQEAAEAYIAFLERSEESEDAERVRRILAQIAPGRVPGPEPGPAASSLGPTERPGS